MENKEPEATLTTTGLNKFRLNGMYRAETFCDLDAGDIMQLTPINSDGTSDVARQVKFFSSIMLQMGGFPQTVKFEIKNAKTLKEAILGFETAAREAGEDFMKKVQESQRRIMVAPGNTMPPRKLN